MNRRRRLLRHMAPAGEGLALDDVADMIGAGSLDDALARWAAACELTRGELAPAEDLDVWAATEAQADSDCELYGPSELAERLGISVTALHQRRHRGALPAPDMTISRVPIWTGETLRLWEEWG